MSKPYVTRAEVSLHNTEDDCWIIIEDKVYNVPPQWLSKHPGGKLTILSVAGKDATEPFIGYHDEIVKQTRIKNYHHANLYPKEMELDDMVIDFRKLQKDLKEKGLFQTNYFWYFRLMIWLSFLFIISLVGALYGTSLLAHMFSALFMGIFWQQLAFLGHDLAHNAVTHSRHYDTVLATTLAVLKGVSCQWWKKTHNVHHVVTNSLEFDPDIQHLPVIAVAEGYFKDVFSLFHGRTLYFDSIARFFVKKQYLLYYPIMSVSRFNLYLQSILLHVKSKDWIPYRYLDAASIVGFFIWYIWLLWQLPTLERRIIYVALSHLIGPGLLSVQITISHFAMPVYEGVTETSTKYNFLNTQFEHSLDVDCPWWLDWLHGGLQFQCIHHLFPRMPRHNLRLIRDEYVIPFAKKWGLKYNSCPFIDANLMVLKTLRETSEKAVIFDSKIA
jgi:fatty acid desaturase